jgi:transcriptional regulator with XRE-family HTH domain
MGAFLRRRRAEIQPAERGVTADGSRRVSGLRREEIARLSGLGLSWYTMLEQGRVENLTPRTLAAIADALGLTPLERRYLRTLADESFAELTESGSPPSEELLEFVRSYQAGHAHLESARLDVLAWNDEADELFAFSRRGGTPNLLTIMAHDEAVRRRFIDPSADTVLAEMLAHARLNLAQYGGVEFSDLIEQIAGESTAFAERWARDLRVMQPRVERGRSYIGKNGARETIFIALKPSANPQYTMILIHPVDAR